MSDRKNTLLSFIYKGFSSGITFVSSIVTARFLSVQDRGDFQTAGVNSTAGMTFIGGYTNYYAFAVAKRPEDIVETVQMGNLLVYTLSLIVWLFTFLLMLVPNPWIHLTPPWMWALLCMPLTFIFGYGSRILNSIHEISWLNRVNIAQSLLFLIIYIPFLLFGKGLAEPSRLQWTYIIWLSSFAIQTVVTMMVAYRLLHRKGVLKWRFSKRDWLGTIDYGSWSSIGQLTNYVNYRIDYWIVAYYLPKELGIYAVAVSAAEILNTLAGSISSVVFARMTGGERESAIQITEIATRQTLISSTFAAIGLYIVAPLFVVFYGHKYHGLLEPLFILLPGLIFRGASNVIIQYATNSLGQPRTSIWMNGVAIVINAIACVIFIPLMNISGGALASTISYVAGFVVYVIWFGYVTERSPNGLWKIRKHDFTPYSDMLRMVQRKLKRG